eukprot:COSAG04_NODE_22370_length_356_cov_0.642023_2_plen_76_part_01
MAAMGRVSEPGMGAVDQASGPGGVEDSWSITEQWEAQARVQQGRPQSAKTLRGAAMRPPRPATAVGTPGASEVSGR